MNISQLKLDTHFLAGSTSASYPDIDLVRNLNIHNQDVATVIWESDGTWHHDDSNNAGTPTYYRTIANASASYLIPTATKRIQQVEVKNGSGDWQRLLPITYHELSISPEEYLTGTGTPIRYALEGNEIRLFPAPGTGFTTMASGLALRVDRSAPEFAVTATTTEPGFPSNFHRILSYGAAVDLVQDADQRDFLIKQKAILMSKLTRYYTNRWEEGKAKIRPKSKRRKYT